MYANGLESNESAHSFGLQSRNASSPTLREPRRHMSNDPSHSFCNASAEIMEHILRHCPVADWCWRLLGLEVRSHASSQTSFVDWIFSNIHPKNNDAVRITKFGILCWKLWENRNKHIFLDQARPPEAITHNVNVITEHTLRARNILQSVLT